MSQIASKNTYELLGNDPELDPDREPEPPTKAIDKPVQRIGKRNGGGEAPNGDRSSHGHGRPPRSQIVTRGDQAEALNNRAAQRDDGLRQDRHRGRARGPGDSRTTESGRGARGEKGDRKFFRGTRTTRDDRHSHSSVGDHEKQAAHGWGGETAGAEYTDEKAGDAIAAAELNNEPSKTAEVDSKDPAMTDGPDLANEDGPVAAIEEEDKTKSYDQYLAEQAEKRLALGGGSLEIRKPNEGSKQKFPEGKAHARDPGEENYFAGGSGKAKREKEAKQKNLLTVDGQYYAPPDAGDRGGRGGRGRGRGEFRGGRGDRGGRGGRGGRGDSRGGRGDGRGSYRGDRGDGPRGGRGFNANDQSAFPALGGN